MNKRVFITILLAMLLVPVSMEAKKKEKEQYLKLELMD